MLYIIVTAFVFFFLGVAIGIHVGCTNYAELIQLRMHKAMCDRATLSSQPPMIHMTMGDGTKHDIEL